MKTRMTLAAAAAAIALLALAGCSSSPSSDTSTPAAETSSTPTPSAAAGADSTGTADIATASSSLGEIVVDGKGMTVYYYTVDTANSGKSACTGACEPLWPAVVSASTTPVVEGVTGTVGTITGVAGGNQITIDGRPIYTFADDKKPGDVSGQGFGGIWFAVSPDGAEISGSGGGSTPAASGAGY
ncbi:hypothetical protein N1027_12065 [Herbiconiux sp. CPCC 205763]|uniref:Lipoprotein with Yx(FWY)xxD motif n=1 Tax=Herbiconiux aconitum TaxID=2970913 RepID=A0ABT2GRM3_9MICO|nr:hypothetical protein [Herbiconiux aconitum]MCS5718871.1 hypothetical protein [Herbiconiux aconitum]